jgi:hypothetical protein
LVHFLSFLHLLFFHFYLCFKISHLRQIGRKYRVISNKMKWTEINNDKI